MSENQTEFKITQNNQTISISTGCDEIFTSVASKMRCSFSRAIGQKNKILAFYSPNELVERRYFFKLISKIAKRVNNEIITLDSNEPSNIKLVFQRANSVQILVPISLKFDRNSVIFDLKSCDSVLKKYLIKMISAKFDEVSYLLRFVISSNKELERLSDIIHFNEHLRYTVNFSFDHSAYNEFCQLVSKIDSKGYKIRFHALANLLEEHFATLGCSLEDDFATVRSQYLRLTKLYHPDHADEALNDTSELRAKFQEISFAYEALKPFFAEQDKYLKGIA